MPYHFDFETSAEKNKFLISLKQNFLFYLKDFPINELKNFRYKIEEQIIKLDKNVNKE